MDKKETMKQRKKMLGGNEKSDDKEKEREREEGSTEKRSKDIQKEWRR